MDTSLETLQTISFSQKAELYLINILLNNVIDQYDLQTRRELSLYPGLNIQDKIKTIISLSDKLTKEHPCTLKLQSFESFERFLRAAGKRDHFVHQFEVFLLGWALLDHYFSLINDRNDLKDKFHWWLITSLSHDIGYPIKSSYEIISQLAKLYDNPNTTKLSEAFSKYKDDIKAIVYAKDEYVIDAKNDTVDIINKSLQDLFQNFEDTDDLVNKLKCNLDHGYNSALLLFDNLIDSAKEQELIQNQLATWTSGAIAIHNLCHKKCGKFVEKINIEMNPFAYILYITDCLQEWERPANIDDDYPQFILDDFYISRENNVKIKFILKHKNWNDEIVQSQMKYIKDKECKINTLNTSNQPFKIDIEYACTNSDLNGTKIAIPKIKSL